MGKSRDKVKRQKKVLIGTKVVDGEKYAHEAVPLQQLVSSGTDKFEPLLSQAIDITNNLIKRDETILEEAERLVGGARRQHYGPPHANFERIAGMWSAYLGIEVTPLDVCCLMISLKVARIRTGGSYHRDSAVDAAGYARLLEILAEPA